MLDSLINDGGIARLEELQAWRPSFSGPITNSPLGIRHVYFFEFGPMLQHGGHDIIV
jgi:hypothetical protein